MRIKVSFSEKELGLILDALYDQVDAYGEQPEPLYDRLQAAKHKLEDAKRERVAERA